MVKEESIGTAESWVVPACTRAAEEFILHLFVSSNDTTSINIF